MTKRFYNNLTKINKIKDDANSTTFFRNEEHEKQKLRLKRLKKKLDGNRQRNLSVVNFLVSL